MLVALYLLVRKDDAKVDTSGVHLVLVFLIVLSEQLEMVLQNISRLFHITFGAFFVI